MRAFVIAAAAVAAIVQPSSGAPANGAHILEMINVANCKVPASGGHPEVDLNQAKFAADVKIPSKSHTENEFVVQICDILNFTDKVCVRGSAVCEVDVAKNEAVEVYAFIDTISTSWTDDALVMSMTGGDCKENPQEKLHTRIFFACANDTDPNAEKLMLKGESQFGCYVEFNYHTKYACGAPAPQDKYKCHDGLCVPGETGLSKEKCEEICEAPVSKFECVAGPNGPECVKSDNGNHTSQPDCEAKCTRTFVCRAGECTAVLDGSGTSLKDCEEKCQPKEPRYKCKQDKCVEQQDGTGVSKDVCEQLCTPPAADKYKCEHGQCVKSESGLSLQQCQDICEADNKLYKCHEDKCVVSDDGKGVSLDQCQQICEQKNFWARK